MQSLYKESTYRKSNASDYNKLIKNYEVSTEIIVYPISLTQGRNSTSKACEIDKPGIHKKSLYMDRFRAKRNEKVKVYYRVFYCLTKLNSNYTMIKQTAFLYWNNYIQNQNLFNKKCLSQALLAYLLPFLQNHTSKILSSIITHSKYSQIIKKLIQALELVHYKISINLKANALSNIRKLKNKYAFDKSTAKFVYNLVRIISTKNFRKYFYAFMAIKEHSDQVRKKFLSNFYCASDFYTKLSKIFNRNYHIHIPEAFYILKSYYHKILNNNNAEAIIKMKRKNSERLEFYDKYESFDTIKSCSLHRLYFLKASKLAYLFKKVYIKLTALSFLKWESDMQRDRFNISISKSFKSCDNSFTLFTNSYETRESFTKYLPIPKNIHDYIDDIQKISHNDIPIIYCYGDYYSG
ncbi:hypothetical protein SteCoe_11787 [Stentor coeruleus]|uniref:Uncharacterized protein n=1 Tax=Stentor coeruleus TaxID=5963 RepID=A0A1R2CC98_9CILI|nr:hypothetical protein SteCoe_11787 [Stentor coeruleus]